MNSKFSKLAVLLTCALTLAFFLTGVQVDTARAATVCRVKIGATGLGDGTSWANAYSDLQMALSEPTCTEIWVAAGTYKPTKTTSRTWSFTLEDGVELYGGFKGTETARESRNLG